MVRISANHYIGCDDQLNPRKDHPGGLDTESEPRTGHLMTTKKVGGPRPRSISLTMAWHGSRRDHFIDLSGFILKKNLGAEELARKLSKICEIWAQYRRMRKGTHSSV